MKPVNKKARTEIADTLRKHQGNVRRELDSNKWKMKQLVEKQTTLKRKMAELTKLINIVDT